jgi:hypothetical protein
MKATLPKAAFLSRARRDKEWFLVSDGIIRDLRKKSAEMPSVYQLGDRYDRPIDRSDHSDRLRLWMQRKFKFESVTGIT